MWHHVCCYFSSTDIFLGICSCSGLIPSFAEIVALVSFLRMWRLFPEFRNQTTIQSFVCRIKNSDMKGVKEQKRVRQGSKSVKQMYVHLSFLLTAAVSSCYSICTRLKSGKWHQQRSLCSLSIVLRSSAHYICIVWAKVFLLRVILTQTSATLPLN